MERKVLQAVIFICGFVPVLAGLGGMVQGAAFLHETASAAMDSHFRYLSGLLFGIGIAFWSCIPGIETKKPRAKVLTAIVFAGGMTRLIAAFITGWPPLPMMLAIGMEVIVTPLIYLWIKRMSVKGSAGQAL